MNGDEGDERTCGWESFASTLTRTRLYTLFGCTQQDRVRREEREIATPGYRRQYTTTVRTRQPSMSSRACIVSSLLLLRRRVLVLLSQRGLKRRDADEGKSGDQPYNVLCQHSSEIYFFSKCSLLFTFHSDYPFVKRLSYQNIEEKIAVFFSNASCITKNYF